MELSPFEFSPPPSDDDELPFSTGDEAEDDEDEPYHLDEPTSERALYSFESRCWSDRPMMPMTREATGKGVVEPWEMALHGSVVRSGWSGCGFVGWGRSF